MLGRHGEKLAPALIQSTGAMQTGVCITVSWLCNQTQFSVTKKIASNWYYKGAEKYPYMQAISTHP